MQKTLMAIAPADMPRYWPEIREEVASIEAPDGFIPEDVYSMCRQGQAYLFFMMVDGVRAGWIVVRTLGSDLHIWQVKAKIGYDVLRVFRDELMQLARNANAGKITYGSTRQAWNKIAAAHGFKVRVVIYESPIDPAPAPPAPPNNPPATDGAPDNDQHVTH